MKTEIGAFILSLILATFYLLNGHIARVPLMLQSCFTWPRKGVSHLS